MVVVEVLSPSSDLDHHVGKLRKYARLPSLIHYLVFSQDGPEVHLWRKGEKGWPSEPIVLEGMDGVIALPEVGATIQLSEIYARAEPKPSTRSTGLELVKKNAAPRCKVTHCDNDAVDTVAK